VFAPSMLKMVSLIGVYRPNYDCVKGTYGMSWLVCLVGGICHGVLGETSKSPSFLVITRVVRFSPALMEFFDLIFE
jgi:hypothetical protein